MRSQKRRRDYGAGTGEPAEGVNVEYGPRGRKSARVDIGPSAEDYEAFMSSMGTSTAAMDEAVAMELGQSPPSSRRRTTRAGAGRRTTGAAASGSDYMAQSARAVRTRRDVVR